MAIDIGSAAIDRASSSGAGYTRVDQNNPANATGTLDTIEIWANADMAGLDVATFLVVSGDNLSTRDTELIGNVTAGSKQTFSGLSIDVTTGDYLGSTWTSGNLELTFSGVGAWYIVGDYVPCTNQAFSTIADRTYSMYGTGTEAGGGWANIGKVNGVASAAIAKVNGVAVAGIAKVNGVAV